MSTSASAENSAVCLQDSVPLSVTPLTDLPAAAELQRIHHSNELILRNSLSLNGDFHEHDENEILVAELRRQEIKIDLLLDMMGKLLVQNGLMPRPRAIRLTSSSISLKAREPFRSDTTYQLSLYLDPALPQSVELFAYATQAEGTGDSPESDSGWQRLYLQEMPQSLVDVMDKIIFRHHRRLVAQGRQSLRD